jgi:hypothetical protein
MNTLNRYQRSIPGDRMYRRDGPFLCCLRALAAIAAMLRAS